MSQVQYFSESMQEFESGISATTTSRQDFLSELNAVAFVDASLPGAEALATSLGTDSRVYIIQQGSSALEQMQAFLANKANIEAIHIYSHGADGTLTLGGQSIDAAALDAASSTLAAISESLSESGSILLYGCNVAVGADGQAFVQKLAALTRASVAASNDITGNNGDWDLEVSTGTVPAPLIPAFDSSLDGPITGYGHVDGTAGAETLQGSALNDYLSGGEGNDTLEGGLGDDVLDGGAGADSMVGGKGNDVYIVDNSGDQVVEDAATDPFGVDRVHASADGYTLTGGVESLVLFEGARSGTGNDLDNMLTADSENPDAKASGRGLLLDGGTGNDTLLGGDGDDVLMGGEGADSMVGGKGDDIYFVDNTGDVVAGENASSGHDAVVSTISYTLGNYVEDISLEGNNAISGFGNWLDNTITGNDASNYLDGGAGNDSLNGGKGADYLYGNAGNDTLDGTGDNEADTLRGGAGNDVYFIDDNDIITGEDRDGGIDSVHALFSASTTSYTLGTGLEHFG